MKIGLSVFMHTDAFTYCKPKCTAFTRGRFNPDLAPVAFDNFFANGQTDTCPGILTIGVKPLKRHENFTKEPRVDSNSIVCNGTSPIIRGLVTSDSNYRFCACRLIFQRIIYEILQNLLNRSSCRMYGRQIFPDHFNVFFKKYRSTKPDYF